VGYVVFVPCEPLNITRGKTKEWIRFSTTSFPDP
jgi:hypothetical protein